MTKKYKRVWCFLGQGLLSCFQDSQMLPVSRISPRRISLLYGTKNKRKCSSYVCMYGSVSHRGRKVRCGYWLQIINGQEKVIAYSIRAIVKQEMNYCVTKRDLLAVRKCVLRHKYAPVWTTIPAKNRPRRIVQAWGRTNRTVDRKTATLRLRDRA